MFSKKILSVLVLCVFLLPATVLAQATSPPTISAPALLDMIAMNKGKVVMINFFATWCPPCREEIPGLVALVQRYPADKVTLIGVSVDQDVELVQPFVKKMHMNYSVFMAGPDIPPLYGVRTIPHNVVYDRNGKLAANAPGFATEADLKEFIDTLLEQK